LSFAVVRNPFSRAVSTYEYLRMDRSYWHANDGTAPFGMTPLHDVASGKTFVEFMRCAAKVRCTMTDHHHLHPQHWYTHSPEGLPLVDRVVRLEDGSLSEQLSRLTGRPGLSVPVINSSGSSGRDWRGYYRGGEGQEAAEIVLSMYALDFVRYSYDPKPE